MTEDKIEFKLRSIELFDFNLIRPRKRMSDKGIFEFEIRIEHSVEVEKNLFVVACAVGIFDETKEILYGSIRVGCFYEIKDLKKYYELDNKKITLPMEILMPINSITISTTRGVLYSNLKGTFLHNAVLPLIDPSSLKNEETKK